MTRHSRHLMHVLVASGIAASLWLLSTEPWGLAAYQLLAFTAPGALLGLGASWAAHGHDPMRWSWMSARHGAIVGAVALPPFLGFVVAFNGTERPQRLLLGFVYAAWIALAGGGLVGLLRRARRARSSQQAG